MACMSVRGLDAPRMSCDTVETRSRSRTLASGIPPGRSCLLAYRSSLQWRSWWTLSKSWSAVAASSMLSSGPPRTRRRRCPRSNAPTVTASLCDPLVLERLDVEAAGGDRLRRGLAQLQIVEHGGLARCFQAENQKAVLLRPADRNVVQQRLHAARDRVAHG